MQGSASQLQFFQAHIVFKLETRFLVCKFEGVTTPTEFEGVKCRAEKAAEISGHKQSVEGSFN